MALIRVGGISYDPNSVIGNGSFGTTVYRGKTGERADLHAAIKVLPLGLFDKKEVKNMEELQKKKKGENKCDYIVDYLMHEESRDTPMPFVCLAMELCSGNLEEFVNSRRRSIQESSSFDCGGLTPKTILHQLTQAVRFLHSQGMVHRDIKPRNCLISEGDSAGRKIMKLSDFGLSRSCVGSTSTRSLAVGSYGWMAPEVILHGDNKSPNIDIFSLGCVFSYVVSDGGHIFADVQATELDFTSIQKNINSNDVKSLLHIRQLMVNDFKEFEKSLLHKLLQQMVLFNSADRPAAEDILSFPLFLEKDQLKKFFHDIGNKVDVPKCNNKKCKSKNPLDTCEHERVTPQTEQLLKKLNSIDKSVMKENWYKNVDEIIQTYCLTKFSKKDGHFFSALCRAIRNNMEHIAKYQGKEEVRRLLGDSPETVIDYYTEKFPELLYHLFVCYQETIIQDPNMRSWQVSSELMQVIGPEGAAVVSMTTDSGGAVAPPRETRDLFSSTLRAWRDTAEASVGTDEGLPGLQTDSTTTQHEPMDIVPSTSSAQTTSQPVQLTVQHSDLEKITENIKDEMSLENIVSNLGDYIGKGMRVEREIFGRRLVFEIRQYFYAFKSYHNARVIDVATGIQVDSKDRKKCLGKSCAIENGLLAMVEALRQQGVVINIVS